MSKQSQIWRVFSDIIPEEGLSVTITGNEHHYVRNVLRLRINESAEIADGHGTIAQSALESCDKNESRFKIVTRISQALPQSQAILVVGLPKPSALDELISVVAELGAFEIHLVKCDLSQNKQEIRLDRLAKIARESLRISKNPWEPTIFVHANIRETKEATASALSFLCDESPIYEGRGNILNHLAAALSQAKAQGKVAVFVGPEASFSDNERDIITKEIGAVSVSLGASILRTPTASASAIAITLSHFASNN
jgi:16S rRNA (uracil1498-N3)-methyltransferase